MHNPQRLCGDEDGKEENYGKVSVFHVPALQAPYRINRE